MKKLLALIGVFALGVVVGVAVGARFGLWEFKLGEAQYKASILATEIQALRAGKVEPIISGMEITLNSELAMHGRYMESPFWWLWPELKSEDEKAIRRAVAYRQAHPFPGVDHTKAENWAPGVDMNSEIVKAVIEGQRIEEHYLRKVLEHYGGMAHNNSLQPTPKSGAAERER
jgi:hypothetical protein